MAYNQKQHLTPSLTRLLGFCAICVIMVTTVKAQPTMIDHINLFAGTGGLALGLYRSNLVNSTLAIDYSKDCLDTLRANRSHFSDLTPYNADLTFNPHRAVVNDPCYLLSASIPSAPYTGKTKAPVDTKAVTSVLTHVMTCQPTVVLIESHPKFTYADDGNLYRWTLSSLRALNYTTWSGVVNYYHWGVPQVRRRCVTLAWTSTKLPPLAVNPTLLMPVDTHRTLREALESVPSSIGSKLTPASAAKYSSNGQLYQRLAWDEPSPVITSQCYTCHPDELRRLTVREVARVQTFPDSYSFTGNMASQYKMLGAATPPWFAELLGIHIGKRVPQ